MAAEVITAVWLEDSDVGRLIAEMPWVTDGIVGPESSALGSLGNIAMRDAALAKRVLGYDWLVDGPDPRESEALLLLDGLAGSDATLVSRL